ncbi:MAG: cache domain-containing protein, partial [Bdellovibrionota bacterium]
ERNCDVQAWATFDIIKNAAQQANSNHSSKDAASDAGVDSLNLQGDQASYLLNKLVSIYVVYLDSFLLDMNGNVIAAACGSDFIGQNWKDRDWFKKGIKGEMSVTALHNSKTLKTPSLFYVAPVTDESGQHIGVLCNCFDWNYALEMIKSAGYEPNVNASVIDDTGFVIASLKNYLILNDRMDWSLAGESALEKLCGFSVERARNGDATVTGFSHTKGYNAYRGKGWSCLVTTRLGSIPAQSKIVATANRAIAAVVGEAADPRIESEKIGLQLKDSMKEIELVVDAVNANNRAVKLLAVNASIQAGLAGADGEGFSIIANEVAHLAKKSLEFVDKVNDTSHALKSAVDQSMSVRLVDAACDAMSKVDRNLFERYCDIQAWSTFDKIVSLLEGSVSQDVCLSLLENIHRIYEVYHDIYVLDLSGKVIATAINRSVHGHNFASKDWFKSAAAGSIYYSDIYVSETLKCPVITFSAPVYDAQGQIRGVICSRFNCSFLDQIIRATIADSKSATYLFNGKGQVVGSKDGSGVLEKSYAHLSLFKVQHGPQGFVKERDEKEKRDFAYGYSTSRGYNTYKGQKWTVATVRPLEHDAEAQLSQDPREKFRALIRSKSRKAA